MESTGLTYREDLDAAFQLAIEPGDAGAAVKLQPNREERIISNAYLVMIAMIVAFLATAGLVWWLG
jgi:hypothetical protein